MAKTYDTYKDSGIAWIGNIPSEWKTCRIKDTSLLYTGNSIKDEEKDSFQDMNEARPYIATKDIDATYMSANYNNGLYIKHTDCNFRIAPPSSTLMCIEGGSAGRKKAFIDQEVSFVNKLCCFAPFEGVYGKYIYYFLCSPNFEDIFNSKITGLIGGVNIPTLKNIECLLPSISEQKAIATYLDEKCGEIDSLISLQEEMISELQAYKQSVITEAVTKGRDPNVPMKDSGVEWIGILPKKWSNAKLKNIIDYIESGVSVNAGIENVTSTDIGVLKTSSVSKNTFIPTECKKVFETELSRVSCPVKGNTIIVSRMNTPELVGACGYVEKDYNNIFLPDRLWQVHFQETVHVKYIYYCLVSKRVKSYFSSLSSGTSSSMQNITQGQFQNTAITLPPLSEQQAIASYLDEKTSQIDSLIAIKQEKITELKDYKKSIIYEYVTGKKKV